MCRDAFEDMAGAAADLEVNCKDFGVEFGEDLKAMEKTEATRQQLSEIVKEIKTLRKAVEGICGLIKAKGARRE